MPDNPTYQTLHILPDNPLLKSAQARFHFEDFAKTLARLIADQGTQTPLTIGISGEWGSGKTTLLRCIQEMLEQTHVLLEHDQPTLSICFANPEGETPELLFRLCRTVWFNAWKYASEDQL
jgi:predicted KAP-like P-loop ATPase